MVVAARTAPKGRCRNHIKIAIAELHEIKMLSEKMKEIGEGRHQQPFLRNAENILAAPIVVLIGCMYKSVGLDCGLCGFANCAERDLHPASPCVFNPLDLGIALSSAVGIAADNRTDNRIMYTIGIAALELNLLGDEIKMVLGIPLSATSKNPFFDR
jgi:uncharacterized ferredoxin-like protein